MDDVRCRKGILQFQVSWDHLDLATWEPIESFAPSGTRHWSIKAYLTSEENKQNYKKAVRKCECVEMLTSQVRSIDNGGFTRILIRAQLQTCDDDMKLESMGFQINST